MEDGGGLYHIAEQNISVYSVEHNCESKRKES